MFEWVKELSNDEIMARWNNLGPGCNDDFSEALYHEITIRRIKTKWRSLSWILILSFIIQAQTITVKNLDPININPNQVQAISAKVQTTAEYLRPAVDRNKPLQDVLNEHKLRMSGLLSSYDDTLGLTPADEIISGHAGSYGQWFMDLSLINVKTGQIRTRYCTTQSFQDLLNIAGPLTKALIKDTRLEDDPRISITQDDSTPIIIGTDKVIHEVHVYEHKPGTHNNPIFIPCSYCGGHGKIPCRDQSGRLCPNGREMDCPYCNINSAYKGPGTHGMFLTGHWEE